MTEQQHGPPKKVGAPKGPNAETSGHHTTTTDKHQDTGYHRPTAFDALAAGRRRREAAVRTPGGDPLHPGRGFHRASTGLRAAGYRQGYAAALRYVLREFSSELSDLAQAKITAIAARSGR